MKKISLLLVLLILVSSLPGIGLAASPWTQESTYSGQAMGKLKFGLKNLIMGPFELITVPVKHMQNGTGNGIVRLGEGLVLGIHDAVAHTVGGALHLVTFPYTALDIPLPNDGAKCIFTGK